MKWYGFSHSNLNSKNFIHNYRRRIRLKARNLALNLTTISTYRTFYLSIPFDAQWKITYLRNFKQPLFLLLNLESSSYYSNIALPLCNFKYNHDPLTNTLNFFSKYYNNYYNLYWFAFFFVYNSLSHFFFHKIRFRGKGYYVYKNRRNTIAFQFGFSHRVKIYLHYLSVKFLSKISILFYGLNKFDIMNASNIFYYKRPINIFTGKGVRFTRQIIYRKAGKISSYR